MRKTETVTVPAEGYGRDGGKSFLITEKSAIEAERWGLRMFVALKGTSGVLDDDRARLGMVGVAIAGLNAFLAASVKMEEVQPLLDEMMTCVKVIRDKRHPEVGTQITLIGDDIEEVATVLWLRSEVIRVHTGFSFAAAFSTLMRLAQTSAA
jgi:hypothetical protein